MNPKGYKTAKQVVVAVIGGTVLLLSIAGYLLPIIPGIPLTIAGLAILATEFVWAKRLLTKGKDKAKQMMSGFPVNFSNAKSDEQRKKT